MNLDRPLSMEFRGVDCVQDVASTWTAAVVSIGRGLEFFSETSSDSESLISVDPLESRKVNSISFTCSRDFLGKLFGSCTGSMLSDSSLGVRSRSVFAASVAAHSESRSRFDGRISASDSNSDAVEEEAVSSIEFGSGFDCCSVSESNLKATAAFQRESRDSRRWATACLETGRVTLLLPSLLSVRGGMGWYQLGWDGNRWEPRSDLGSDYIPSPVLSEQWVPQEVRKTVQTFREDLKPMSMPSWRMYLAYLPVWERS